MTSQLSLINHNCLDLLACSAIYFLHSIIFPDTANTKNRHEYKIELIKNLILMVEFIIIRQFHISFVLDLFILFLVLISIIPGLIKLIFARPPEFVLISSKKDGQKSGLARYRFTLEQHQPLDPKVFQKITKQLNPQAILLDDIPAEKVRLILLNSNKTKLLKVRNGVPEKLTVFDIIKKSNFYVDQRYLTNIGLILQNSELDELIRQCLKNSKMQLTEIKNVRKDQEFVGCNAFIDLTCLNGKIYNPERVRISRQAVELAYQKNLPFFLLTPLLCDDKTSEVYIRVYEVMAQQYPNTKIIRTPSFLFPNTSIKGKGIQHWSRGEDLPTYLRYAASIPDKVVELNNGEYFFNHELKRLIEELNRI